MAFWKRLALILMATGALASPAFAQSQTVTQPSRQAANNNSSTIAVTNTFQSVLAATDKRYGCAFQNNGTSTMWVYFGPIANATKGSSFVLGAGQALTCGSEGVVSKDQVSITGTSGDAFTAVQDAAPTVGPSSTVSIGGGGTPSSVNVTQWGGVATTLGQKAMAASVPVVIASDQSSFPVTPAATESHLGEVGGNQITVQVAQTVTASSAYATGNAIGGLMTIAAAARVSSTSGAPGTGGLLQSVVMNIKSAQTTPVDIIIFNSNPTGTTCTDKTAIAIAAADFDKVLGVAHMTDFTSGGTPSDGQSQNLAMPYALTSSTTLYACAVTRSTPTYASTSDVSFGFRFLRN